MKNKLTFLMIAAALALAPAVRADGLLQGGCKKERAPKCPKQKCDTCKKECVPTVTKKTIEHRKYSSSCESFCIPKCRLGGCGSKKSCDPCNACPTACDEPCHKCGKVRTRKVLIVKIRKEEQCVKSCEAVDCPAPSCPAPVCVPAPCYESVPAIKTIGKTPEKLPNPPMTVPPMKK